MLIKSFNGSPKLIIEKFNHWGLAERFDLINMSLVKKGESGKEFTLNVAYIPNLIGKHLLLDFLRAEYSKIEKKFIKYLNENLKREVLDIIPEIIDKGIDSELCIFMTYKESEKLSPNLLKIFTENDDNPEITIEESNEDYVDERNIIIKKEHLLPINSGINQTRISLVLFKLNK